MKSQLGGTSKVGLPFYEPPPRKTSSEIINEAKLAIKGVDAQVTDNSYATSTIKPLQTQRPFTPRDKERLLFGKKSKPNRPPSSFSLRYLQTENELSIPISTPEDGDEVTPRRITAGVHAIASVQKAKESTKAIRQKSDSVSEITGNKIFNVAIQEVGVQKIKLPTLDSLKALPKKKLSKNTFSLDNLPEEAELPSRTNNEGRKAFSSPQEKTEYNEKITHDSPFGRSSKKQSLSQCLLLEPQNLSKIFENKQIIENSETLFVKTGYLNNAISKNKLDTKIYALDDTTTAKNKTVDEIIELLITESVKTQNDAIVIELLDMLYSCMEKNNMLTSKVSSKTKIHILKCLYKFVESQNEKLLLSIARIILALYHQQNGIPSLIKLWKIYLERTLKCYSMRVDVGNAESNTTTVEDVMIKIIRIIANIAINSEIGRKMNNTYGGQLIDELLKVVISNPFKKNEELVLSVLSTLNNLSFYYTADLDPDIFHIKQVDIIEDDINLLRTTVGVFVNLMADNKNRIALRNSGGIAKLISVMNNYGQYDWSLSMLVCQVIWNFCIDSVNLYELISDSELEQLMAVLVDFLDEEKLFGVTDTTENNQILMSQEFLIWEEFANVATNLLEKIEQFFDTVETLQFSSFPSERPKTRDSSTNISFSA
ncbi:armadillo repeat containing 2 [Holotrichia oblita]|uniref:Armadillo repeat containing 2 n=2 Tax=Holotrichia oblita TaxID=644536 RepID=A0ACB9TEY4_HOLOL|nr:armadillo repeat containing 2 [Holotrichia oblita]KAI4465360.1 armadillo repeat containing 2 [Holotrichia oblita]